MRTRLIKFLALSCCSGILLSVQCPPLMIQSVKMGISSWVGGTGTVVLSQLSDLLIGGFLTGTGWGTLGT